MANIVRFLGILFLLLILSASAIAKHKEDNDDNDGKDDGDDDRKDDADHHHHHHSDKEGGKAVKGVTYDGRSLIINGRRELLFSGSIHYPRSTPEMWPEIINKAKHGGLNAIETYVFWNIHEPVQGQFNFSGRYDLVRFIKVVQEAGMFLILRIGPYVEAEWNFGGFPYWLKEIPGMIFRTDNEPFKDHMQKFVTMIVEKMRSEKLFAPQGGPIILAQIENEYNNVEAAFQEGGLRYVKWAGEMALSLNAGVPWVMCKEKNAPGAVINTCNGRNCGDTFTGPNSPNKPSLWTENWTAQYRVFGDPPSQRAAEDLAYAVTRFFSAKNGTLVNYYMYHGGTNFGREGSAFVMTRYYDEAPLDEYGLYKEPKFGHLRDVHHALRLCRKALFYGNPSTQNLGKGYEVVIYEKPERKVCAAFLTNTNPRIDGTVNFRGVEYSLPRRSISILPDCKTVVFNSQRTMAQHNARTFHTAKETTEKNKWWMYQEYIPKFRDTKVTSRQPLELMNMTKDTTDYLWYTTSFKLDSEDLPMRHDIRPVLQVSSLGHAIHAFVNGFYIGTGHGSHVEKSFVFTKPMDLNRGYNHITILGLTIGLPNSGAYLEHRLAGVHTVGIQGLNAGTLDLSNNRWGHRVGLDGERLGIFTEEGLKNVQWTEAKSDTPATWYKRYFDAPRGNDPVSLNMTSMGKGRAWVNGECIGRYWVSYLDPYGKPSQSTYHVPRSWLKPKDNLLVLFEEQGGKPEDIIIMTAKRDNICAFVSEDHPPSARSFQMKGNELQTIEDAKPKAHLKCDSKKVIQAIVFASFGNPTGPCGNYTIGSCHAPQTWSIIEKECLGKSSCVLPVSAQAYGADPKCPGTTNTLTVQVKCAKKDNAAGDAGNIG
ncbi:beta-galactosidase 11-like [Phoenix dactylifera]|uniref:Beta-galactosidase n=1 Tax=Phoenix dactylifera TaxID=42345 RepID=A0A8B8ZR24_PHODC|nr:beta-galactosidase 11-like [Phoenix dactylifera]